MTTANLTKVIVPCRLSYAHLWEPDSINGSEPKYSVSCIIDKNDKETIAKIKKAIEVAKDEGKGKWGGKIPANLKTPLRDGDIDRPEDEAYADSMFLNANSKQAPQIVDRQVQPILDQSEVYSGCYGRVSITFYAYNSNGNKGIAAGLGNVQKLRDGEPLGSRANAINDGKSYVEDYSYTDEILVGSLDCSNFTDASDMLSYAKMRVADYCKPNYSYKLSVLYLSGLTGYEHEIYGLGDTVRVMDEELELDITTRIVRMEKNIQEPWNTVVELSTTIGTLSLENDASVQEAIDSVIKSFIAPRLIQATINTQKGEVNAMYELGVPVKYTYRETEDGIVFTHPDGQICEIKVI